MKSCFLNIFLYLVIFIISDDFFSGVGPIMNEPIPRAVSPSVLPRVFRPTGPTMCAARTFDINVTIGWIKVPSHLSP